MDESHPCPTLGWVSWSPVVGSVALPTASASYRSTSLHGSSALRGQVSDAWRIASDARLSELRQCKAVTDAPSSVTRFMVRSFLVWRSSYTRHFRPGVFQASPGGDSVVFNSLVVRHALVQSPIIHSWSFHWRDLLAIKTPQSYVMSAPCSISKAASATAITVRDRPVFTMESL